MNDRINREVRDLWADRLESGEVPQVSDSLRDEHGESGRCCLGVLTDVYIAQGGDEVRDSGVTYLVFDEEEGEWKVWDTEDLPPAVIAWAGLESANPVIDGAAAGPSSDVGTAIWFNDSEHMDFAGIAALVRAMPLTDD